MRSIQNRSMGIRTQGPNADPAASGSVESDVQIKRRNFCAIFEMDGKTFAVEYRDAT